MGGKNALKLGMKKKMISREEAASKRGRTSGKAHRRENQKSYNAKKARVSTKGRTQRRSTSKEGTRNRRKREKKRGPRREGHQAGKFAEKREVRGEAPSSQEKKKKKPLKTNRRSF